MSDPHTHFRADPADREQLLLYKRWLFSRCFLDAKPGERVAYLDGVRKHPAQQRIHFGEDWKRHDQFDWIFAGQRSGKSVCAAGEGVFTLGLPRTRSWIVAPTYKLCEAVFRYIWEYAVQQECFGRNTIKKKEWSHDKRYIETDWGSWIECRSADNPNALVAEQLDLLIEDEAARVSGKLFSRQLVQRLANRRGRYMGITSPMGRNWFYRRWVDADGEEFRAKGHRALRFSIRDNPYIDEDWIEEQRALMSPEEFLQEFEGIAQSYSGMVWPEFSELEYPQGHVFDPNWIKGRGSQYRGIDVGFRSPAGCVWARIFPEGTKVGPITTLDGDVFITQEYEETATSHEEHAQAISAQTAGAVIRTFISPDSKRRGGIRKGSQDNAWGAYRENGIYGALANDDVGAGLSRVGAYIRSTLEDAPSHPRLFVSKACPKLMRRISEYIYEDLAHNPQDKDQPERPLKRDDHLPDALRYLLVSRPRFVRQELVRDDDIERYGYQNTVHARLHQPQNPNVRGLGGVATVPYPGGR